jgi:hypothetical protein
VSTDVLYAQRLTTTGSSVYGIIGSWTGKLQSPYANDTTLTGFILKDTSGTELYRIVAGPYGDDNNTASLISSNGMLQLKSVTPSGNTWVILDASQIQLWAGNNTSLGIWEGMGIFVNGQLHFTSTTTYPQIYGDGTVLQMSYGNNSDGVVLTSTEFRPAGSGYPLGSATHRWGQIYSTNSVISTSDENLKNSITPIQSDIATKFIMKLNPITYKLNDGTSGRTHWGMIAQETETALTNLNMTTLDFAGVCYDKLEDGTYRYGLRYEEFIAPIIAVEQNHEKRIEALEQAIKAA